MKLPLTMIVLGYCALQLLFVVLGWPFLNRWLESIPINPVMHEANLEHRLVLVPISTFMNESANGEHFASWIDIERESQGVIGEWDALQVLFDSHKIWQGVCYRMIRGSFTYMSVLITRILLEKSHRNTQTSAQFRNMIFLGSDFEIGNLKVEVLRLEEVMRLLQNFSEKRKDILDAIAHLHTLFQHIRAYPSPFWDLHEDAVRKIEATQQQPNQFKSVDAP
jgi:hypothetical protein